MVDEEAKPRRWVYIGRIVESGSRVLAQFQELGEDDSLGQIRLFDAKSKKVKGKFHVGVVYSIKVAGDSAYLGSAEHVGLFNDIQQRAVWQTIDRAVETTLRVENRRRTEKADRALLEVLRPLRDVYQKTDYRTQRAIEMEVLAFLRTKG